MYVRDIIDEAKKVLGRCDNAEIFKRLSDAARLGNSQVTNSTNTGVVDLCVCSGCLTLPAFVGTVLAVAQGGSPTVIQDEWFSFVVNGPGISDWVPWGYTKELGQVCTFRDPSYPVKLVAQVESALDSNCELRVFGFDVDGKEIYTDGPGGVLEKGFLVPTVFGFAIPHPTAPVVARIDRIQKEVTDGFVKLIAVDPTTLASHTSIGYYCPWETSPTYRRIQVPDRSWVRIKYSRVDVEVRGLNDWINCENREALKLLLKSVKLRDEMQYQLAQSAEVEGIRLLNLDRKANTPPGLSTPQIIDSSYPCRCEGMFY